jgi:hypothetical protein
MLNYSKRLLIICEDGKSSKLYFESFKRDEKLKRRLASVSIEVVHPKDHSPVGLVTEAKIKKQKAKKDRNPYDEIWIVLDKDYHANIAKAFDMAYANGFKIALSVICFEYWVLLHFEKTKRPFKKCAEIISYIRKKHHPEYLKKENAYYELKDNVNIAIENGRWIVMQNQIDINRGAKIYELSAYTDVHLLVESLLTLGVLKNQPDCVEKAPDK